MQLRNPLNEGAEPLQVPSPKENNIKTIKTNHKNERIELSIYEGNIKIVMKLTIQEGHNLIEELKQITEQYT